MCYRFFVYFIIGLVIIHECRCEWDQYDDEDLALSIPKDAVGISKEFRNRVLKEMKNRQIIRNIASNRCYCNYGIEVCGHNSTCLKHDHAACYHSIEEFYDEEEDRMQTRHLYGCASLERGSGASHLTCNSWKSSPRRPRSIACCYEGNYCNRDIEPPPYVFLDEPDYEDSAETGAGSNLVVISLSVTIVVLVSMFLICCSMSVYKRLRKYKDEKNNYKREDIHPSYLDTHKMLLDDSGSGSGQATLIQRTVRQDLTIIEKIGQGRYGEVRKATYRGSFVAVKTFYTTDEDSWRNEREVYQTNMINHENILQFVAADIWTEEDSMTKMLIVTDYHELGSLSDYLRREETLTTIEALRLIYSCVCGIEHLHTAVHGTGNYQKPEIAHRDIKSKNIIVKRAGVCCIADFGLALRCQGGIITPERFNIQVGTKRYMAPEVLSNTLNPADFAQFKAADIYSIALVMWEVARRVEDNIISELNEDEERIESIEQEDKRVIAVDQSDSSGIGDSISSDGHGRVPVHLRKKFEDISLKAKPYSQPFDGSVDNDPSFDQMREVVCVRGIRPPIEQEWTQAINKPLGRLSQLMSISWHMNPQYRYTGLKLKKEIRKLIESVESSRLTPVNGGMKSLMPV